MLLTFDAMTGRMEVCGERGADTDCEHPTFYLCHADYSNNVHVAVADSRNLGRMKIVADNIVICNLSIKILC